MRKKRKAVAARKKRKASQIAARKKRKGQAAALQAINKRAQALQNAAHVPRPQPPPTPPPRLLTKAQVLALVPVTFPTIWSWMRAGKFPRAKIIGTRSVWVEAEIYEWIAARPQRPLKGDANKPRVGKPHP